MPESNVCEAVCEVKLVPSITVSIHPTIENPRQVKDKEKEIDTTQDEVEKSIGLRVTGGVDFKMPITIFHASFWFQISSVFLVDEFSRSKKTQKPSTLA